MYSSSLLVLALAVFGASAQSIVSSGLNCGLLGGVSGGLLNGVSGINGGLLGGVSGVNSGILGGVSGVNGVSTPVIENVPLRLPSIIHPATVQESCNCYKTIVRPTFRKEVFTIPSVQRFFQTTSTPVVETVPYVTGSAVDVPTVVSGVDSGLIGNSGLSGLSSGLSGLSSGLSGLSSGLSGLNSGLNSGIVTGGIVSGVNSGFGSSC